MKMFGLSDLGHILRLEVENDEDSQYSQRIISNVSVLDTDKSTFTVLYDTDRHGDLVYETITEEPSEIYNRISKVRSALERRELSFMRNIFLLDTEEYRGKSLKYESPETFGDEDPGFMNKASKAKKPRAKVIPRKKKVD